MTLFHVGHPEILAFADDHVNLKRADAKDYRDQINRLREQLLSFINEHPGFGLERMLLSGSLAKGTALKTLNDADVAVYVNGVNTSYAISELLDWLEGKLRKVFPNLQDDQVRRQNYSICISLRGTGLDIDVVPVISNGQGDGGGNLISQEDGSYLYTNIPKHLEFIRRRKQSQERHFAQMVRLVKYWVSRQEQLDTNFKFKSFLVELVLAHLVDEAGLDCSNYPEALANFFNYLSCKELQETIAFSDYYAVNTIPPLQDPIRIIDPVNAKNNAARQYTNAKRNIIIDAAFSASDAIRSAEFAPTKGETVAYWQEVFGPRFSP